MDHPQQLFQRWGSEMVQHASSIDIKPTEVRKNDHRAILRAAIAVDRI